MSDPKQTANRRRLSLAFLAGFAADELPLFDAPAAAAADDDYRETDAHLAVVEAI